MLLGRRDADTRVANKSEDEDEDEALHGRLQSGRGTMHDPTGRNKGLLLRAKKQGGPALPTKVVLVLEGNTRESFGCL